MKTIPQSYTKYGYTFDLIERTPYAAIYSQTRKDNGKLCAYEVVRVRSREASTMVRGGVTVEIEGGEYLPKENEWGKHAKTVSDLETARARLVIFKPIPKVAMEEQEPRFEPDQEEDPSNLPPDQR